MTTTLFEQPSEVSDKLEILANNATFNDAGSLALQQTERPKVASYCRVSTLSDPQEESLENQIIHYTTYIRSNPEWQFAGTFSDRGKSGTKIIKRTGFSKMIRYALDGKIDIILCKSISRFARNVIDTLNTVRVLKENGVRVIFERENIDTGNMQSEFILTVLSVTAQEESRSISDNLNWSLNKRFERGEPIFVRILGYKKEETKAWIIVEREAHIVREAFDECLKGKSPSQIAKMFIRKGFKKANGRSDWSAIAVRDILKNERYTGDVLSQKTYTKDHLSHQAAVNDGAKNQYYIRDHHKPIIDRDVFDKVQQILGRRSKKVEKKGKRKSYPLSGRIVCAECGSNLQRFICRGKVTWRCGNHIKSKILCGMTGIGEENILKALIRAFVERYQISNGTGKGQIIKLTKEIQSAVAFVESDQNKLRLDLERALLAENTAIIKLADTSDLTQKRISIEGKIAERESCWTLIDEDDGYRKEALDILDNLKSTGCQIKEFMQYIYNLKFLRAWVVRVKTISPFLFSITWVTGDETEIEVKKGEDAD